MRVMEGKVRAPGPRVEGGAGGDVRQWKGWLAGKVLTGREGAGEGQVGKV